MSLLRDVFGHDHFRPGQETIIDALINGTDVMAILPTGGGKSLCYQLPALVLPGMTIVISPLISLMEDQISSLKMRGVAAYAYHSHLSSRQRAQLQEALEHQKIKLLYISPERLANEAFFSCISRCQVSMICVDEAHCLSQWGDEFRPAYRKIGKLIPRLNSTTRPVICAFTGSATPQIRDDIIESLGLQDPLILARSFDRPNLYFQTIHTEKKMSALMPLLQKYRGLCGIIYCLTRNSVEALAIALKEESFPCLIYHGGMDAAERLANQEAWMKSKGKLMIATSAFGMGIDKPDVRFVIHFQLPTDMESYYQEAGRAGRDGKPSDCVLISSFSDLKTHERLRREDAEISKSSGKILNDLGSKIKIRLKSSQALSHQGSHIDDALAVMRRYASGKTCLRQMMLGYFDEEIPPCGRCSVCEEKAKSAADMARSESQGSTRHSGKNLKTHSSGTPSCGNRSKELQDMTHMSWTTNSDFDQQLFTRLVQIRLRLSRERGCLPYQILSDADLKEMAISKPTSLFKCLTLSGVSPLHMLRRAKPFIEEIKLWVETQGCK